MKARKQISLEELFRLYPQLRLVTHQETGNGVGGQGHADDCAAEMSADQAGELAEA